MPVKDVVSLLDGQTNRQDSEQQAVSTDAQIGGGKMDKPVD